MVCKSKGEIVNCHALFQRSFFKTDLYLSVVLNLLQKNYAYRVFFIVFKTLSNCTQNVQ